MNAVVKTNPQLPAAIQRALAAAGGEVMKEVTGGVTSGFPIISYRGKVWRIKKSGEEHDVLDENEDPIPSIEVVLVKSNPMPSKIFYENAYEEGSTEAPRCWSADGVKPDVGVQQPVCKTCAACPKNVWGSKITESGSKTKACADARRMAVVSKAELEEKGKDAPAYLMRVPPASLNPLKDFAEKVLKPKGLPYFAVVVRVGFDTQVSYPKLTFKAARLLSEEEAEAVVSLRDSEDVRRILAESVEFDEAGTPEASNASSSNEEATASAPAASAPKKKSAVPKPRPAEEEDVGIETPAPAPKKKAAPAPVVEEDEDEIAPPPPAKKAAAPKKAPTPPPVEEDEDEIAPPPPAKKKAAPAPPPVEEEEDDAPPAPAPKKKAAAKPAPTAEAGPDGDFDSMLDSILSN